MDVFFVISGFLITTIILKGLDEGKFSFADFYIRRIRRIFPALTIVLLATWALGWMFLEPQAFALLGKHIAAGAGFVANILLWRESGYFDVAAKLKPLLHLWSLGIEEQFYFFWPAFLVLAWKTRTKVIGWIVAVIAISFLVNVWGISRYPVATFYLPFARFWELLVGGALAHLALHHPASLGRYRSARLVTFGSRALFLKDVLAALGVLVILAATLRLTEASAFPGWLALIPTGAALALIAAGEDGAVNARVLSLKPLVWIGLISYPLYLWHWPLLVISRTTSVAQDHPQPAAMAMVALAILLSALTYVIIEKPIRFGFKGSKRLVAVGLSSAMAGTAALGLFTLGQAGWVERYPAAVRPFLDDHYDYKTGFRNDTCLLSGSEKDFAEECAGTAGAASDRLMLIWGDSHGAMLYRALDSASRERGVSVAQYTSSSCPPVVNFTKARRPLCRPINDWTMKQIQKLRPQTVVLAHDWPQSLPESSLTHMAETVALLRGAGAQRIVMLGPVPHWMHKLYEEVLNEMRSSRTDSVPLRMRYGMDVSIPALDDSLSALAGRLGLEYVSPYRLFCDGGGCLVRVPSQRDQLTAFDDSHLTPAAARMLVRAEKEKFFPAAAATPAKVTAKR